MEINLDIRPFIVTFAAKKRDNNQFLGYDT